MKKLIILLCLLIPASSFAQKIECNNTLIKDAFNLAVNIVDVNTRRGILAAGGDYGGEWTRDISINSWNGASLLRPEVAERSLWSVTIHKDTIGHQYWDKIIWVEAAYNHYLATGDRAFLKQAYICSANTMKQLEAQQMDTKFGLFMGPSVFNDGIAGYPEPIYEPTNYSSAVTDHKGSAYIKCLSTNCVYYGAYLALSKMAALADPDRSNSISYAKKAQALKNSILVHLYDKSSNTFYYLVDQNGKPYKAQEGLGISFAVIFGIINGDEAHQLISNASVSKYGITSIYPDFPRNSPQKPGRHNNIIWPMVNGFFAKAAIASKSYPTFSHELFSLTHLALDEDKGNYDFREIYNPTTGQPDGGYQANGPSNPEYHWQSCRLQTWSATGYISMVLNGVFGLRLNQNSISFAPYLPDGINHIELKELNYRNSVLNITIKGQGNKIKTFTIDDKPAPTHAISTTTKGAHSIVIDME